MTFASEIEEALGTAPHTVVIHYQPWGSDSRRSVAAALLGQPLAWSVARPLLDYNYDDGYGGQDCHGVYAYSDTDVAQVHEYDGATWVITTPLVPTPCVAETW